MSALEEILERPLLAGLRQYRRQFVRRKPVIERGLTMPSLFRFNGDLDRRLVAESDGWAVLPQSSRWHPGQKVEWQLTAVRANSPYRP